MTGKFKSLVVVDKEWIKLEFYFAYLPSNKKVTELAFGGVPEVYPMTVTMEKLKALRPEVDFKGVELKEITISW